MKNIVLIGLAGCGKTTLGQLLAQRLGRTFLDTDLLIEAKEGRSISVIFEQEGEGFFRNLEKEMAQEVSILSDQIIATGGGMILQEANMTALKQNGVVVFIDRAVADIIGDVEDENRPLLKNNKEHLYRLYDARIHLYRQYADLIIQNNAPLETMIEQLCAEITM